MTSHSSVDKCIANCVECHDVCIRTVAHCLSKGGKHAAPEHIVLLLDCAQICETSADFMLRGSALHAKTCGVCAEICERCAESCEAVGKDKQMKSCA